MSGTIAVDLGTLGAQAVGAKAPLAWPSNSKSKTKQAEEHAFDAQACLDAASMARKAVEYRSNVAVFNQGDPATSVLYIRKGAVRVTVVNKAGNEAVVAILGPGDFLA